MTAIIVDAYEWYHCHLIFQNAKKSLITMVDFVS